MLEMLKERARTGQQGESYQPRMLESVGPMCWEGTVHMHAAFRCKMGQLFFIESQLLRHELYTSKSQAYCASRYRFSCLGALKKKGNRSAQHDNQLLVAKRTAGAQKLKWNFLFTSTTLRAQVAVAPRPLKQWKWAWRDTPRSFCE